MYLSKILALITSLLLVGCGDINLGTPEETGEESDDLSTPTDAPKDTKQPNKPSTPGNSGGQGKSDDKGSNKDKDKDKPSKPTKPTDCENGYKAKMVYENGEDRLVGCIRDDDSPGEDQSSDEDEEEPLVLRGCPFTYELVGQGGIRLTYAPPATDPNPRVIASYTIAKGLIQYAIHLADGGSLNICQVSYWDGTLLVYFDNNGRMYEKDFSK